MINSNSSTDFYNECMRDDFPYKVVFNNYYPTVMNPSTLIFPTTYTGEAKEEEEVSSRFDLLDIRPKKIEAEGLTIEKIQRRLNKIKDEINGKHVWMDEEKPQVVVSGEHLVEMFERDLQESIENSIIEYVKKQRINSRSEILDL